MLHKPARQKPRESDILPDFVQSFHNFYIYSAAAVVRARQMLDNVDDDVRFFFSYKEQTYCKLVVWRG